VEGIRHGFTKMERTGNSNRMWKPDSSGRKNGIHTFRDQPEYEDFGRVRRNSITIPGKKGSLANQGM